MFVAIVGVAIVGVIVTDDDHDKHSKHRDHRQYGDSQIRQEISKQEQRINNQNYEVEDLKSRMKNNFYRNIQQLQQENNYPSLNSSPEELLQKVKADMRREIENEISREQQELDEINKMISRINELELQSKHQEVS